MAHIEEIRTVMAERLLARRAEIEKATLTRVYALVDPAQRKGPEYAHGLRAAVSAALDHGFEALRRSEERPPPIPAVLLAQARLAARGGISLDTVLRRYFAGYTLFGDFVIQEADAEGWLQGAALQRLLRAQAAIFDRLLAAVSEEYGREERGRLQSAEQRRADRVKRLLDGEPLDSTDLGYDLSAHHVGILAVGPNADQAVSERSRELDRRLLLVRRGEGTVWAWLGANRAFDPNEFEYLAAPASDRGVTLAVGEPAEGVPGWRLTHRQARAALPIAVRSGSPVVRYEEVALLASILRDDLLVTSLEELYLAPLRRERDGGTVARETLRAYFQAERNVSSAAAALGVSRQAVGNRLRAIELCLGRSLGSCAIELEIALRLADDEEKHTSAHLAVC